MGAMHGTYLVAGSMTEKIRQRIAAVSGFARLPKLRHATKVVVVFALVSASFVFFRAADAKEGWFIISHLGSGILNIFSYRYLRDDLFTGLGVWNNGLGLVVFLSVIGMEWVQYVQAKRGTFYIFDAKPKAVRYGWYYAITLVILLFGYFGAQTFIYFRF
jgi:hypothetical protein